MAAKAKEAEGELKPKAGEKQGCPIPEPISARLKHPNNFNSQPAFPSKVDTATTGTTNISNKYPTVPKVAQPSKTNSLHP